MSVRQVLEIPQNESINLLIDNAVRVGGSEPTGTIQIDANGLYNVSPYAAANVNVPEPSGSISITQNGTVDVKNYASANVNVPQGVFPTGSLSITENGSYDVTNYAGVNVNVSGGGLPANYSINDYTIAEDVGTITVPYDNTKTIQYLFCYALDAVTTRYTALSTFTPKLSSGYGRFVTFTGNTASPTSSASYGGITIDDVNSTVTIDNRSGTTVFKAGLTYRVLIIYS